jgi:hypothetical protein
VEATQQQQSGQWAPGWYEYPHGGGRRFWDGQQWTDHFVPPLDSGAAAKPGAGHGPLDFGRTVLAVWAGFILGWGTVFLGSQIAEDSIYWPVKAASDEVEIPAPPVTPTPAPTPEVPEGGGGQ